MKYLVSLMLLSLAAPTFAGDALDLSTPLTMGFQNVLKVVQANLNGWSKLSINDGHVLWTPHSFYAEKISDPKQWVAQIRELGFCQPDKAWKAFPVLSVSNDQLADAFEQVAMNPKLPYTTQMMYSETVIVGGKARNVSYDYRQNGPAVHISCSARNELGDVQSIAQNFDIRNPKQFQVQQKKNGKLLEI